MVWKHCHWIFLLCEDVRYRKGSLYDPLNFMFILVLGIKNSKNQSQMWHHDFEECVRVPKLNPQGSYSVSSGCSHQCFVGQRM